MTDILDVTWILPVFLYAETHYRFRYFWSYLRKKEPEIIADAPHRIEPGNDIPLLILVKDAHQYPCSLLQVAISSSQNGRILFQKKLLTKPVTIKKRWWWIVSHIPTRGMLGWVTLDVQFEIESGNGRRIYHNDNYRSSSQKPLEIFVADSPLPKLPGLHFGDAHVHSSYTNDQVEYGAPLEPSVTLSKAIGLSFFCVTDHSYDLDDEVSDYLRNDPLLPKWNAQLQEVAFINRSNRKHKIIFGEEVSCRNSRGENIHFLLYGKYKYIPGSGDSAERWLRTRSEYSARDVLAECGTGKAVAAHPQEHVPLLQKLLLGRGAWTRADLQLAGLTGTQFLNGQLGDGFERGKKEWVRLLLSGIRILALAGNDAHGNFNRFRQIGIPFLRIAEHDRQVFGKMRTGLFLESGPSEKSIFSALQKGNVIISDGPVATFSVVNDLGATAVLGESIVGGTLSLHVTALSSDEFGDIRSVRVYCGLIGRNREDLIYLEKNVGSLHFDRSIRFKFLQAGYLRMEVITSPQTSFDKKPHFTFTNPVWFTCGSGPKKSPSEEGLKTIRILSRSSASGARDSKPF